MTALVAGAHEMFYKKYHIKTSSDGFAMIDVIKPFLLNIGSGKYVNLKPFTNSQNVQPDAQSACGPSDDGYTCTYV